MINVRRISRIKAVTIFEHVPKCTVLVSSI